MLGFFQPVPYTRPHAQPTNLNHERFDQEDGDGTGGGVGDGGTRASG